MSNFEIRLNGSNIVNPERKQAFEEALNDDHRVQCEDDQQKSSAASSSNQVPDDHYLIKPSPQPDPVQSSRALDLDQVVEQAYDHQVRTMNVHQQFLDHQREQVDLISKILSKQGDVLENSAKSETAALLGTFQRTLDNFQAIREQSLQVHQAFLNQQSDFSDRILDVIGEPQKGPRAAQSIKPEIKAKDPEPAWVVHNPHIVLDDDLQEMTAERKESEFLSLAESPNPAPAIEADQLAETLLKIVSENTGYPAEMLDLTMDLEADLGIDSIKRVEILAEMEDTYPSLQPPDPEILAESRTLEQIIAVMNTPGAGRENLKQEEQPATGQLSRETSEPEPDPIVENNSRPDENSSRSSQDLLPILLEIVAENTGYPVEMLESSMDMEADLGIDSIKRVEILAEMEDRVEGLPTPEAAVLAEMRTIGEIAELMDSAGSNPTGNSLPDPDLKKKASSPDLKVERVELKVLPQPDRLEVSPGKNNLIILGSDGTDLTPTISESLAEDGWKVVIWDYPERLISKNGNHVGPAMSRVRQESEGKESIQHMINQIKSEHGTPLGFIHLHPPSGQITGQIDKELIEQVYFIAGSIRPFQTDLEETDRPLFFTVTRNDGYLGTNSPDILPAGSGLSGLAKSIRWEWPDVFCRAVDLQRDLPIEQASSHLLREIYDPDRSLVDVGINESGRVTLAAKS